MQKRKTLDSSKKMKQQKLTGMFISTKRDKEVTEKDKPKKKLKQSEKSEREGQLVKEEEESSVPHGSTSTLARKKNHVLSDESDNEMFEDQDDDIVPCEASSPDKSEPEELPKDHIESIQPNLKFHNKDYKDYTPKEKFLHAFDLNYKFGPCIGSTRLERWERAHRLGLNPPKEVKDALTPEAIEQNPELNESVFYGRI